MTRSRSGPLLERVAGALLPVSRRDEILGDLCERYESPWRYALDALQLIAAVAFSHGTRRVRRQVRLRLRAGPAAAAPNLQDLAGRVATRLASSRAFASGSFQGRVGMWAWWAVVAVHALGTKASQAGRKD